MDNSYVINENTSDNCRSMLYLPWLLGQFDGSTTMSMTTLTIMTLITNGLFATLNTDETQHKRHSA